MTGKILCNLNINVLLSLWPLFVDNFCTSVEIPET